MTENNTHPNIKAVIIVYALGRDNVSCKDYMASYPAIIQDYALLGLHNILDGKVQ
jgi:hypothetical protein